MLTSPKIIITALTRYWVEGLLYFFLHIVEIMKKIDSQIMNLFLINMPAEHKSKETKLAPSGSSWRLSLFGLKN